MGVFCFLGFLSFGFVFDGLDRAGGLFVLALFFAFFVPDRSWFRFGVAMVLLFLFWIVRVLFCA